MIRDNIIDILFKDKDKPNHYVISTDKILSIINKHAESEGWTKECPECLGKKCHGVWGQYICQTCKGTGRVPARIGGGEG